MDAGGAADWGRATLLYGYLMSRARLERRSERVLRLLERVLPARFGGRPLLVVAACALGWYVAATAALGAALFGLLRLASPVIALSLLFASLLAIAASCGLSTAGRTISPPDKERLLMAPLSERRAYCLALGGGDPLRLLKNLLVVPVVSGFAASVSLAGKVSLPALWVALALVASSGCALAVVVDRLVGAAWVRRASRGARGGSLAAYGLSSALACATGSLASHILLSWLSKVAGGSSHAGSPLRQASSLPEHALDEISPLLRVLAHPASPVGAAARWAAEGSGTGLALAALWAGATVLAAAFLAAGGGRWYREGLRDGRHEGTGGDLLDLAETCYAGLGRILYRGDRLVEVQLRNLCRRRETTAAGPFHLVGGPLLWLWVGLAWGAAPALGSSDAAAGVFVLLVGGWAAATTVRTPFEAFRASLSVDAEGRGMGLYRMAGIGALDLYVAKLRAGRLIAGVPLCGLLTLVAVVADLSLAECVLLGAVGLASWEVWPRVELLPGLASPHFVHEHPDEVGTHREQQRLSELAEDAGGAISLRGLVVLLTGGLVTPGSPAWTAAPVLLAAAVGLGAILRLLDRRAARLAEGVDLPP